MQGMLLFGFKRCDFGAMTIYIFPLQIAEEEDLLAAALFPLLSELVIHSNPLTTLRSGMVIIYFIFIGILFLL